MLLEQHCQILQGRADDNKQDNVFEYGTFSRASEWVQLQSECLLIKLAKMTDFASKYAFVLDDSDDDSPVVVKPTYKKLLTSETETSNAFFG